MYKGKHCITYYDLDLAGRLKLSALLRMVHIAADINATELGIGFREMSALGLTFILQRFALRIARMPSYGENVTVRTWPDSVARGTFTRKGDMYGENGKKIMEWASLWIIFNINERKIMKPSALPVALPAFVDCGVEISPEKIVLPPDDAEVISRYTHTVRYADVDTNMHMNNSVYGDVIGNAVFPTLESATSAAPWREVHINYLAEAKTGDEIDVAVVRDANALIVTGKNGAKTSFSARIS